ncbi:MAG: DUF4136 domain-containing protein [Sphingomonas sp.]|uniref:DUF4136 domain-containing protein n=1 Tax=Sphingomonas sp. TaxID=28214 RepID=UPI001B229818|nr:DUF4136 domain-containing protein [Sphingomonas sp.]MBO9622318.1 DUF4136 domain-containing protein [Sphingomonas sp.]
MKSLAFVLASAGLLAGCAARPVATAASYAPGVPASARSFAVNAAADDDSKAAARQVEARLRQLGYAPAASNPDLLVEVSMAERARGVGAFTPGCTAPDWTARSGKKWLMGGGTVQTLNVRVLDAHTSAPVYQGSASLRARSGSAEEHIAVLTAAALPGDPRQAATAPAPSRC